MPEGNKSDATCAGLLLHKQQKAPALQGADHLGLNSLGIRMLHGLTARILCHICVGHVL